MEKLESCVPPGFRFHPTDEELVGYYLKKKIASQKIDLDVIRDIDLYKIEPWELQERCRIGYEEQTEWYLFSHKDKKYPTGTRTNRATLTGFWKATGRDKAVYDKKKLLIGMRKTLVFYRGRAPNGKKTDWIIHEYRLESDENAQPQEEGWVICRAFKKRTTLQPQTLAIDPWESPHANFKNIQSHPHNYLFHPIHPLQKPHNLRCKQESELKVLHNLLKHTNNNNGINNIIQLPKQETPSLLVENKQGREGPEDQAKVTDWRALDKFVASQLSHGDEVEFFTGLIGTKSYNFEHNMAAVVSLLQEEELDSSVLRI